MELMGTDVPVQVRDVVQSIRSHIRDRGKAPTTRELATSLGYASRGSVRRWVRLGRELGLLDHQPGGHRCDVPVVPAGHCHGCGQPLPGQG
jgi:hypothetical protein